MTGKAEFRACMGSYITGTPTPPGAKKTHETVASTFKTVSKDGPLLSAAFIGPGAVMRCTALLHRLHYSPYSPPDDRVLPDPAVPKTTLIPDIENNLFDNTRQLLSNRSLARCSSRLQRFRRLLTRMHFIQRLHQLRHVCHRGAAAE